MTTLPVVHRMVPSWNGLRTAAIGTSSFADLQTGAEFLQATCATLRQEGFEAVVGPMDGNTWGRYRLPGWSDGSPAFAMEPTAGPDDLAAYQAAGFSIAEEHISATAATGSRGWSTAGPEMTIESWDGTDASGLLADAHRLVMTTFRDTAFFTPIPQSAFQGAYLPLLQRADPRFILRARDSADQVVGLTLAFPDPMRRGAVVLKTYAGLVPGAGRRMADRIHALAGEAGYNEVIHALMRRGIASEAQSRKFGGQVFRRYFLMGRIL
jgi:hypothetical protein